MSFTEAELEYLGSQPLGRLATVQPNGTLQVNPVGFRYEGRTGTIEIGGFGMAKSRKFRNVAADGRAAFVIDDITSTDPWRVRCLEIRGWAEAIDNPADPDGAVIRLHPRRIISFGVDDPEHEPHELVPNIRDVAEPTAD